jgi:hypothetical protein
MIGGRGEEGAEGGTEGGTEEDKIEGREPTHF